MSDIKGKKYNSYTGENITVLDDIEGVRQRFGMYAGSIEGAAQHLVDEIIDNSVDEFLNDHATIIKVDLDKKTNRITITDDGRGLPVDIHPEMGIPTMEILFTSTHSGGKFDKDSFKVSSGLNGVGSTLTNGLSSSFDAISIRNGYEYSISFEKGRKTKDFKKSKKRAKYKNIKSGTIISFIPDEEILGKYAKLDEKLIKENIEERSYVNAGLKFIYNEKTEYIHKDGIRELIKDRTTNRLTDIYYFSESEKDKGNLFEIAFTYSSNSDEKILSFANGIRTSKGTHETGFKKGITDSMKAFINENKLLPKKAVKLKDINGDDIRSGITAVINIRYADADYSAQTKDELTNPELFGRISTFSKNNIDKILNGNKEVFRKVATRVIQFTRGRMRASSYRESLVKVNNKTLGLADTGKFVDCYGKDVSKREILIIEGDSAGGSVKQARDPEWQAVFPLRGKILNTNGMKHDRILANNELNNLLVALFGHNDLNKIKANDCRFNKILLVSDSDEDGRHINSLLCNFLFEFLGVLFEEGYVYAALPPRYRFQNDKGKFLYIKNDEEQKEFELMQVEEDVEILNSENISLEDMLSIKKTYMTTFTNILHQYSISDKLLSRFLIPNEDDEDLEGIVESIGLTYNKEDGHVTGIYKEQWHDFYEDLIYEELDRVEEIHEFTDKINFTHKGKKHDMYPMEFIEFINEQYNFKYDYFKGKPLPLIQAIV